MEKLLVGAKEALQAAERRNRKHGPKWTPPTGNQVRLLRKRLHLSQSEFAKQYGLELASLKNWEQGRSIPEGVARQVLWMIDADPVGALNLINRARELCSS